MSTLLNLQTLVLLLGMMGCIFSYKKVILVPGILSNIKSMERLKYMIERAHKGTNVTIIDAYPDTSSVWVPLDRQLPRWKLEVVRIMKESPDGVHLVCHSQGGLICQGIIETVTHNVHTFIALSSPLYGQYGIPDVLIHRLPRIMWFLKKIAKKKLSGVMYRSLTQHHFSISNYWRDPRESYERIYLSTSSYLPYVLNHANYSKMTPEEECFRKRNYLKLQKVILVGGPSDGVIEPWQSSLYGYYDHNEMVIDYNHQPVYTKDWFGLRTLDNEGRLYLYAIPGVKHVEWHKSINVFNRAIEPWLV